MQPERFVTCGLVLRETVTRDADKILTVLTPDRGRLSVIARGARRKGSRVAAACQLLAYDEMTLRRKGECYYLAEASTIELFDGVRQDIEKLALAAYFAELTEAVCQDAMAAADMLPLLLNALFAADIKKVSHNVKDLMRTLLENGLNAEGFMFDTALAAYLVDATYNPFLYFNF